MQEQRSNRRLGGSTAVFRVGRLRGPHGPVLVLVLVPDRPDIGGQTANNLDSDFFGQGYRVEYFSGG